MLAQPDGRPPEVELYVADCLPVEPPTPVAPCEDGPSGCARAPAGWEDATHGSEHEGRVNRAADLRTDSRDQRVGDARRRCQGQGDEGGRTGRDRLRGR